MKEKVDSGVIKKYKSGRYSFRDLKKLASWFQDSENHENLQSNMREEWEEFNLQPTDLQKDLSSVYLNVESKINSDKKAVNFKDRFFHVYLRVAAVLLIPLLIYSSIVTFQQKSVEELEPSWVEVNAPYGARTLLNLPDGTEVTLNSGSQLKYLADFKHDRKLEIEGEAYFDVVHDSASPFVVHTDFMDVKVLGTKFSVVSAEDENTIDVILEEGKVQLTGAQNSFSEVLTKDESFVFDKVARTGKIRKVDARYLTSWKDGYLVFRKEPLGKVMQRLGRWYNVQFQIEDPEVEDFKYRATFHDEPLEEVLRLIALTAPISYEIKERKINTSDEYEPKIVIIKLEKQD
jgi:ferric-dicitrate binding protein FerR (iron transport regulator)